MPIATVEGCACITITMGDLFACRAGRDSFGGIISGTRGSAYEIEFRVQLGANGHGTVTVQHAAFHHLTALVPSASYVIELRGRPWHFGGWRWWFVCPRTQRRVAKLYLPNGASRFAGRRGHGLGYQSQQAGALQKAHARQARAYAKLGGQYLYAGQPVPRKPKWMRWATYERLAADLDTARSAFWGSINARLRAGVI